jgi:hypothetical protein
MGGPQSRSGRRGEEKILDPTGTGTPTSRPSSPYAVAIPTPNICCISSIFSSVATDAKREMPKNMWLQKLELRLLCGASVFVAMSKPISEQLLKAYAFKGTHFHLPWLNRGP